jgi:nucleoside 2-deoxyribosyltransferase
MSLKLYLAAQYPRRDELKVYAAYLRHQGIEVTSRWLEEKLPLNSQLGDDPEEQYKEFATFDIEDIDRADAIVFFSENPLIGVPRGGRHFEHGYAIGTGKPAYIIGPKENVFHYIGRNYHFKSFGEFVQAIEKYGEEWK